MHILETVPTEWHVIVFSGLLSLTITQRGAARVNSVHAPSVRCVCEPLCPQTGPLPGCAALHMIYIYIYIQRHGQHLRSAGCALDASLGQAVLLDTA